MNTESIKEIQQETAYSESISVQQALLKVWNECEQEKAVKNNAVLPHVSNSNIMKDFVFEERVKKLEELNKVERIKN